MSDLMSQLEAEAADLSVIPSEEKSARLRELGMELVSVDLEIARMERDLQSKKERRLALMHREMPDVMMDMGQDVIGLPDAGENGVDLELRPYFKAGISAEWDEERRREGFDHLVELGGASLIRNTVTLAFDRGDHEKVEVVKAALRSDEFLELLQTMAPQVVGRDDLTFEIPPPEVGMVVPWNTLTSFVREWHGASHDESDPVMDLEKLGATVGHVVKIKPRKG